MSRVHEPTIGVPVPWYRINGWIPQASGLSDELTRYCFYILGVRLWRTPWFYSGSLP